MSKPKRVGVATPIKFIIHVHKWEPPVLATAVAFSDSFRNCHEWRGYLNSIRNDDRDVKDERRVTEATFEIGEKMWYRTVANRLTKDEHECNFIAKTEATSWNAMQASNCRKYVPALWHRRLFYFDVLSAHRAHDFNALLAFFHAVIILLNMDISFK